MNPKRIILVILVLFLMSNLFSQSVAFTYDDNGNRQTRTINVEKLQSKSVSFPVVNPKSLIPADSKAQGLNETQDAKSSEVKNETKSEDREIVTIVYPNPNTGLIKIDISNLPLNTKVEMKLYDLNGNELVVRRNFESHSEIDINHYIDGVYILRIMINERVTNWKIVKTHN